jgi:hypothetical protein
MVGLGTEKIFRRRPIKGFLLHPAASIGFLLIIFVSF